MLADMDAQTEAARQLLYKACTEIEAGAPDAGRWSAMCKLVAGDTAMRVTTDAVQVLGGYGYIDEFPVERMMRDAKITQLYEGTQQIQRLVIARALLAPRLTARLTAPATAARRSTDCTGDRPPVRIVVLVKPVPDTAVGRRAAPARTGRLDRAAVAGRRQRQRRVRARGGPQADRGATAARSSSSRWPAERARHDAQGARDGRRRRRRSSPTTRSPASDTVSTVAGPGGGAPRPRVRPRPRRRRHVRRRGGRRRRPGVAALLGLPYLSYAAKIEPDPTRARVRVHRISPTGYDVLEAPMPALSSRPRRSANRATRR